MPILMVRADADNAPHIARRVAALTGQSARKIEQVLAAGNAVRVRQTADLSSRLKALGGKVAVVDSHAPQPRR
jgi:hypothetical protein